jgi:hypothetical protein
VELTTYAVKMSGSLSLWERGGVRVFGFTQTFRTLTLALSHRERGPEILAAGIE